jgi:hypothetical protein
LHGLKSEFQGVHNLDHQLDAGCLLQSSHWETFCWGHGLIIPKVTVYFFFCLLSQTGINPIQFMKFFVDSWHMDCVILFVLSVCQILALRSHRGSNYFLIYMLAYLWTLRIAGCTSCHKFGFSGIFISVFKTFWVLVFGLLFFGKAILCF